MSKYDKNVENVESKIGIEMSKNVVSKMSRHIDMSFSKMSRNVEILLINAVVTLINKLINAVVTIDSSF